MPKFVTDSNLGTDFDVGVKSPNKLGVRTATTTNEGVAREATPAEVAARTLHSVFVSPAHLPPDYVPPNATESTAGIVRIATDGETSAATSRTLAVSPAALKLLLDSRIQNLINAAPAAIDTLGEIAAALGNDANFAATITNALALKAPLASPALTGIPTAPTAAVGTATTQVASTAFVAAEIANKNSVLVQDLFGVNLGHMTA